MIKHKNLKITVVGGGTGSFVLLDSLKLYTNNLKAIVNMSDDGGSSGMLRDELGVLPPGDVRQCLVALSTNSEVRNLFNYRFGKGSFKGQSLGNIILSGLELQHNSFLKAIDIASSILNIRGQVIPATVSKHHLVMKDGNKTIKGEFKVSNRIIKNSDAKLALEPKAKINLNATKAILDSDLIIIAPGNLNGSLLPIFLVDGFKKAINTTDAKIVYVSNLVTKPGQTDNWHVVDYVHLIEKYIGKDQIDIVLYNNEPIPKNLLKKYAFEGEFPVNFNEERFKEIKAKSYGAPLVARGIVKQDPKDKKIKRTLIRHDSLKICKLILENI